MANGDTSRTVCNDDMIYQRGPGNNVNTDSTMWPEIVLSALFSLIRTVFEIIRLFSFPFNG